MRRIVLVLVALLFLLALAVQSTVAMAAPRLDRADAAPRLDRAEAAPRMEGAERPVWQ